MTTVGSGTNPNPSNPTPAVVTLSGSDPATGTNQLIANGLLAAIAAYEYEKGPGSIVADGTPADAPWVSGSGTIIAILKTIANAGGSGGGSGTASATLQTTGNTSLASIVTNTTGLAASNTAIATNTTGLAASNTAGNASLASIATNTTGLAASNTAGNTSLATIATNTTGLAASNTTGNTSLASIATNTTGSATTTLQTTGNTSLATIATNTTGLAASNTAGNTSLATIATNTTGLATSALQTTGNTSLATIATNTAQGAAATGVVIPTGGSGFIGWLSGIYQKLSGTLSVAQPDVRVTGQTINSATANIAVTVPLNNGEGVVGWVVTGLTASAAILSAEGSNDGGTTWGSINTTAPGTGSLSTTVIIDGQFRMNAGGHTNVRLRVSTVGTGNITISYNASSVSSLIAMSSPLPTGNNVLGTVAPRAPQNLTMTSVTVPAGISTFCIAVNPTRKTIQLMNIGIGFATAKTFAAAGTGGTVPTAPGMASATSNAVTINLGYPLEAASAAGHQGGSTAIYDGAGLSLDEWDVISTAGTTILVVEGN